MFQTGFVKSIVDRGDDVNGFGFIRPTGFGDDIFFSESDLAPGLLFDKQLVQREVLFQVHAGRRGPRARNVRAAR